MVSAWGNRHAAELGSACKGCDVGRVECCSAGVGFLGFFFLCVTWKQFKTKLKNQ